MISITFAVVCILAVPVVSGVDYQLFSEKKVTLNSPYKFSFLDLNGFLLMEVTLKNISPSVTAVYLVYTMKSSLNKTDPDMQEREKVGAEIKSGEVKILIQRHLKNYGNILVDVELQTRECVCHTSRVAEASHWRSTHNYDYFPGTGSCMVPKPCEIVVELDSQCEENFKCSFDASKYICTFNKRKMLKYPSYNLFQTYDIDELMEDYTYIDAVDSFYRIHKTPKNWHVAKQDCAKEGASLFYPENRDEADAVISFWKLYQNNNQARIWMFVGITDITTENTFKTIDGKSISEVYYKWTQKQPDNHGDEDCVHMNQEGKYNDISCVAKYSFICKKSSPLQYDSYGQKTTASFREDYTYIDAVFSFYKIHFTPMNWHDAKQECVKEGASLFYPEKRYEADAVISFWNRYQNNSQAQTWVFVGISDIATEGIFETIDGKSMFDLYNIWKENQPDNTGDEDCVHMDQDGLYNDIACDEKYSYICKKRLLASKPHNKSSVIGVTFNSSAVNTKLMIDLELFDNNTSVHVETSVHSRDILWSDKIIMTEKDVVKEPNVTLTYCEATDVQFSCEEFKSRSKYLSVAFVNTTENKIQTLNKTIINNGKLKMADNGSILCCLYYVYDTMNDGKKVQITRFVVKKTLLKYQDKESMPPRPANAVTIDNTTIIISSVSASVLALLLLAIYVFKKRHQRETIRRENSQRPLPQIPSRHSFSEPDPNIPFYQNMLFRRECDLEIQTRDEPHYTEVMNL